MLIPQLFTDLVGVKLRGIFTKFIAPFKILYLLEKAFWTK